MYYNMHAAGERARTEDAEEEIEKEKKSSSLFEANHILFGHVCVYKLCSSSVQCV